MTAPGDIIKIGSIPAVICAVHGEGEASVIYRDAKHHVIGENAVWQDDSWRFKSSDRNAGWFADKKPGWRDYVAILEAYHKPPTRDFMTRLGERPKKPRR